ncbi:hypothetical protein K432DRAFT_386832 [Lepidopterella palustris CBS 459.81]|uniref:Uncharacterized protein n=1 Tax=Lepidopterella palustris CBS 459.81 TaxID=1314670 RepID=A0A8E2DZ89_9PEZI|nr:hypothetical protein K432DRAFT_386832 [Lepidopterella palustris CBS 459.81]
MIQRPSQRSRLACHSTPRQLPIAFVTISHLVCVSNLVEAGGVGVCKTNKKTIILGIVDHEFTSKRPQAPIHLGHQDTFGTANNASCGCYESTLIGLPYL